MADARAGRISYAEWFHTDLAMLREAGAGRDSILAILAELRPTPGAAPLVRDLRRAGSKVAILSGGIDLVRTTVLGDLGFDAIHINRIMFDPEGRISGGTPTAYDRSHKVQGLETLSRRFGVPLREMVFVGDGPNDVQAAQAVGCAIAWGSGADPGLIAVSKHHICEATMDALRPLLLLP